MAKFYSDFLTDGAFQKIAAIESTIYTQITNKTTGNTIQIGANVDNGKFEASIKKDGAWGNVQTLVTKSDLDKVAKIDRSTSSAWVGDKDKNMIFNCNFNSKTLIVTFADGKTVTFQGQ